MDHQDAFRHGIGEIHEGAVVQEGGIIADIGTYEELSRKHPTMPVIGTAARSCCPASSTATIMSV